MRTFVFKAYSSKRNRKLHRQIDMAAGIWNHCIALHKRYFRLFGKHLNQFRLMKHLTKLKRLQKHSDWKCLGSQAIQDIAQRIEKSYQLFFKSLKSRTGRKVRPPSFRKRIKYQSFTLKQAGYAVSGNTVTVGKQQYRFFKSRDIEGQIKTLTIKRDTLGDIYLVIVTDGEHQTVKAATTKIAGFDFGLKDFLTESDGSRVAAPQPLKQSLKQMKKASRDLSRKSKVSNNRKKARRTLALLHRRISNQRKDFHYKLAALLVRQNQHICIEDLNIQGMKALWGRKVSDLGFASFVSILEHQASKTGCTVVKIDRWYPSSKTCHCCGTVNQKLQLRDRTWTCSCGVTHDRDINAAITIRQVGMSTCGLGDVRPAAMSAIAA
jgi:putative transposase